MLKRVGNFGLALIIIIAPMVVGLSKTALADPGTCPATVSPQTIYADSTTDFIVSITNSNATPIQWILINPPSSNYSFVSSSANGWSADVLDSQDVLLTGSNLAPGDTLDVNISTQVADYQPGEADWNIYASDTPDASDGYSCTALYGSTMTDNTPEISDVAVSNVTTNSVTISWMTSVPATSRIFYGVDSTYGNASSLDSSATTNHSVILKGLIPNTDYHYEVQSTTSAATQTSGDNTFATAVVILPNASSQTAKTPTNNPLGVAVTDPADSTPPTIGWSYKVHGVLTSSPTITGTASDNVSVAAVQYSTDDGMDWLRADTVTPPNGRKVTFSFTPLNLADGTYNILARAINSGGKITTTSDLKIIIDHYPPIVGGTVFSFGPQVLYPSNQNMLQMIAGVPMNVTLSSIGGATNVSINAVDTKTGLSSSNYNLQQNQDDDLWHGIVDVSSPGTYRLIAHGVNGAGRVTDSTVGMVTVEAPGNVLIHGSNQPVTGARITVYCLSHETNSWVLWDGAAYGQTNPQPTTKAGSYALLLPAGSYYIKATAPDFRTVNTTIFSLHQSTPVTAAITMSNSFHIGPLHLPWLTLSAQPIHWAQTSQSLSHKNTTTQTLVGSTLPSFTLNDIYGGQHNSLDWLGKPTVVSIIAPWVPMASDQVQALSKLSANQSVNVIPIGLQANRGQLLAYNAISGSKATWLPDPTSVTTGIFDVGSVPANYFVDRNGTIKKVSYGYLNKNQLLQDLAGL